MREGPSGLVLTMGHIPSRIVSSQLSYFTTRKLRLRKELWLAQDHKTSKKQKQDPNSSFLTPESVLKTATLASSLESLAWHAHT